MRARGLAHSRGMARIISVASTKGGVGKTTIAYELAWLLGGPLVDLDWDAGGATRQWGYRHERRLRAPLLDALERSSTPVPLRGVRKPDLVPSHPDFVDYQPAPEDMAGALEKWAGEWGATLLWSIHTRGQFPPPSGPWPPRQSSWSPSCSRRRSLR